MSLRHTIFRNTAVQAIGKVFGIGLSIITASLVFRYLQPAGFGQYTGVMAFLQIFGILMDAGLYMVLLKTIATAQSQEMVNNIFTLRIVSGVIFLGSAPLVAMLIGRTQLFYSHEVIVAIAFATLFYFFISLNQLLSAVFQNALRTHWIAIGEFVGKCVLLLATILVIIARGGLIAIMATVVCSAAVNFGINFWASRRYVTLRFAWDGRIIRKILRQTWPIALSIIFTTIYFKGDSVLLTFFASSAEQIGWYGAPYKLLEVLITFPAMFAGLVLPILTNAWHARDHERFVRALQSAFDGISVVVLPMVAGTLVLAPEIITIIAGPTFFPAIPLLRILIVACAAIFYGTLFGYLVVVLDRQRAMMWGYGFVAITALAGYLLFIPRFGLSGAAWVTVYSECTVALIALIMTMRFAHVRLQMQRFFKAGVATILMAGVLMMVQRIRVSPWTIGLAHYPEAQAVIHLVVVVPLSIVVYVVVLFILQGITSQEMKSLIRKAS